jgi:hypothetical protein
MTARPFFIVSSGRSGTAMLTKALAGCRDLTIEHEYLVHLVQPLAMGRYQGLADKNDAQMVLSATHGAALDYAQTPWWGDSSNKLSWLIPDLLALFPDARFVHLMRDGRKVASSYFHKLADECYDDRSTHLMARYLAAPKTTPPPPPEKKYWWPQPKSDDPWADEFPSFGQFERIVWHWAEVNRVILAALEAVPPTQHHAVQLEELRARPSAVAELLEFLGQPYASTHFAAFARPHNVNRPVDTPLTHARTQSFWRIAGPMMDRLGYADAPEYAVHY